MQTASRVPLELSEYLRNRTQELRYSSRSLAQAAGLSHPVISKAIAGVSLPEPETLDKIAPFLQTSAGHLKILAGYMDPPPAKEGPLYDLYVRASRAWPSMNADQRMVGLATLKGIVSQWERWAKGLD
jgi:transcriptional regulator with XRE-family HTH domain